MKKQDREHELNRDCWCKPAVENPNRETLQSVLADALAASDRHDVVVGKDGAKSVFDEAANVYYLNYMELDKRLRAKLSICDLREIFKKMVEPAIEKVRRLDREHRGIS